MKNATVFLLWGPNGGELTVCGVFANREEADERAARFNAAEKDEGFPAGGKLYMVEAWRVS